MGDKYGVQIHFRPNATQDEKDYLISRARVQVGENIYLECLNQKSPMTIQVKEEPNEIQGFESLILTAEMTKVRQIDVTQYYIGEPPKAKETWWSKLKKLLRIK